MLRLGKSIVPKTLSIILGLCLAAGCVSQQPTRDLQMLIPNAHRDKVLFREINKTTSLANLPELRKMRVADGDIAIRVWRGFGTSPLEGVFIERISGQWYGYHIKADQYADPKSVKVERLETPKSGWESFWKDIVDKGLMTIQQSSENECDISSTDGLGYVVEINQNSSYRNYFYPENAEKCNEAEQIKKIGEIIGSEFDSGKEECKTTEWFACAAK
jgi:hypothetical protein